mmetsp:Transcript_71645/g.116142  ORF Transcript_71645/g.116142 Transcript_71645/m.116142 type:complete len:130 (-) Transcript_71645:499-888(-)
MFLIAMAVSLMFLKEVRRSDARALAVLIDAPASGSREYLTIAAHATYSQLRVTQLEDTATHIFSTYTIHSFSSQVLPVLMRAAAHSEYTAAILQKIKTARMMLRSRTTAPYISKPSSLAGQYLFQSIAW